MYGIEIRFGVEFNEGKGWLEEEQNANIKKLLDFLNARPLTYQYSYWRKWEPNTDTAPWGHVPHITIKCGREDEADRIIQLFPWWKSKHLSRREFEICTVDNCYKPTAANGKGCDLFVDEVEAQDAHEIHEYCVLHVADNQSRQIARTMEVTNDTPRRTCWTKIFSFQIDKQFFAQRVDQIDEGDYEMGEQLVMYSTRWVGPHTTREEAIQAARDYEEEN
jgi:hypothetical protein